MKHFNDTELEVNVPEAVKIFALPVIFTVFVLVTGFLLGTGFNF